MLNVTYNNEEIYIESTDIDRTLMSAECNLAGLYEPTESQEWNPYIHWQPIPIHTVPIEFDVVSNLTTIPNICYINVGLLS